MKEIMKASVVKEATTGKVTDTKAKDTKAKDTKAKEAKTPKANIAVIITKLPDKVTPKMIDELFGLNDGGKTVRRHLRKHFADKSKHEHKADWQWAKTDPVLAEVIEYFAERYAVVKTEKRAEAK